MFRFLLGFVFVLGLEALNTNVQTTYHWHLQQPLYWSQYDPEDPNTYQCAYQNIQDQNSYNDGHPYQDVAGIFGTDDRIAIYQYRAADSINAADGNLADMGAQISYSGCLIDNINSLSENGWNGGTYQQDYNQTYANFHRSQLTSGGLPRMDLVSFTYHHALAPLIDRNSLEKQIQIHKIIHNVTWGPGPATMPTYSKGFFPAEMAFSERNIPTLLEQGIEWTIVSNNHISRACQDYPYSQSGDNNNPPNPSDQINPSQSNYFQQSISRGCTPNNAYPFSYRPHYAKYVDPVNGTEFRIVVVPAAQAMSWDDGYACYGTQDIDSIAWANDPEHPMLILLAHDGDNDFAGGYSYYMQCVPSFTSQASQQGYNPTTIQQYLTDFPVDPNDVVHVEDGPWVNADGDFGAPRMINWNWPLTGNGTSPDYDIPDGWQCDERNWAVITAGQNYVETAEQMSGKPASLYQIQSPTQDATPAELAWHFFLPSMTSGYMYYGTSDDMPDKPSVAVNQAIGYAQKAISQAALPDQTPPSLWYIMRHPYNPGGYGMGSLWNYQYTLMNTSFYIYTFGYDVSGIKEVTLHYRTDDDGVNPLDDNANEVFSPEEHGLSGVSEWIILQMTPRQFPKFGGGVTFNYPPTEIASEFYIELTDLKGVLIDYFVEAVDVYGNEKRSDIYHCYVGNGESMQ